MARTTATAGQWTTVPDTGGQMWLQCKRGGVYVDNTGSPPATPDDNNTIPDGDAIVVSAGLVVNVWPISDADVDVFSEII